MWYKRLQTWWTRYNIRFIFTYCKRDNIGRKKKRHHTVRSKETIFGATARNGHARVLINLITSTTGKHWLTNGDGAARRTDRTRRHVKHTRRFCRLRERARTTHTRARERALEGPHATNIIQPIHITLRLLLSTPSRSRMEGIRRWRRVRSGERHVSAVLY